MKRMKNKKLNGVLIASALASAIVFGGLAAGSLANGGLKLDSPTTIAHATAKTIVNSKQDGKVYYVGVGDLIDSDGKHIDDTHTAGDGTSADAPMTFKTFVDEYMPNLKGGDTVKIMPGEHMFECNSFVGTNGTYIGTGNMTVEASGTFDNYIIFEAQDPTQKTTINFKQQSFLNTNRGIQLYGSYIYWHDIDVCGAGDNGLYIAGSYNVVENCEFYNNRDTGLQLGRAMSEYANIVDWPSYNLVKNCTAYNNYDNETYGENADGFAAKLTVGYGNIFDGCIAYRNSDDGWDLYAKSESGNIGAVIIYNCVAFENGFIQHTQEECNKWYTFEKNGVEYCSYNSAFDEKGEGYDNTQTYLTRDGDGNGFKLGGGTMEGDVILYNCLAFNNRMHGVTDNSNPGVLSINNVTSYNNGATTNEDGSVNITAKLLDEESKHNNIDIERTDLSYNNFTNILSVNNGNTRMGTDAYRGSGEYSILTANDNGSESIKILDNMDADSLNGKVGERITSPTAAELFAELPDDRLGLMKLTGRTDRLYYIHKTYREADGTINMGNLLKIISQPIAGRVIGSDLTKTSYDEYSHYEYTYLTATEDVTGNGVTDATDALLTAVKHMLYIPTNANAVYQDFNGITSLNRCRISWVSSNPDVVKVDTNEITSSSNSSCVRLIVYRQDEEKQVTLTATIMAPNGETVTKEFNITVKVLTVGIGSVVVNGLVKGKLITNQYSLYTLPEAVVTNSTDNNGKLLARDKYDITEKYLYSTVKGGHQTEVKYFTPSTAGVYEIVYRIDLKGSNEFRIYSYNLFVVSGSAKVDFADKEAESPEATPEPDVSVGVDFNGYYITGNLNNVSGTLYAMVSATEPAANDLIAEGEKYQITDDYIYVNYEHNNSDEYTVYFVICNPNGAATSKVYSSAITKVDINDKAAFNELLASGGETNKIYALNCDIDYSGDTYKVSDKPFVGYLDGRGHTISNVKIEQPNKDNVGVFYRLEGGTIVNLNFDNISITGRQNVGIIAAAYSGTVANIKITDVNVQSAEQRVGGLIGRLYEQVGAPMVVDRISLINKKPGISITAGQRAAGICGFLQTNTKPTSDMVWVKISNCYIDAVIGSSTSKECGGIFGTFDTEYGVAYINSYRLEVTNCVFAGSAASITRCGGILAYHKGLENVEITNCVSIGDLYHAGVAVPITTAEKNCSGIVGGYPSKGKLTVIGCYAKFIEHNTSSDVTETTLESLTKSFIWKDNLKFDTEIWEYVDSGKVDEDGAMLLEAPFIKLK